PKSCHPFVLFNYSIASATHCSSRFIEKATSPRHSSLPTPTQPPIPPYLSIYFPLIPDFFASFDFLLLSLSLSLMRKPNDGRWR
ncbi:unnamed protein product, partial [Linum tenue]